MSWKGIERNKLDYIITDLLPVEISGLFSFYQFYLFLTKKDNQKKLDSVKEVVNEIVYKNEKIFEKGWATRPLKYKIMKGCDSYREMSIVQPFSALNIYLFMELYQKNILLFFESRHDFSIRYHKLNSNLYYKSTKNNMTEYFQKQSVKINKNIIEQSGNYFNIYPYKSINSFMDSLEWKFCNFKYNYYEKMDYKGCFDSIYSHSFSWIIEKDIVDSKNAKTSNLFITIDRVLQNINGHCSNGIVVGPEFSRMLAEILLQEIDYQVKLQLMKENLFVDKDYKIFRYVDDLFVFSKQPDTLKNIKVAYSDISQKYLLRLNELKFNSGETPFLSKSWIKDTREISDKIYNLFYHYNKDEYFNLQEDDKYLVRNDKFYLIKRIRDEIAYVIKNNKDDTKTIVSYLLTTILNNIKKKSYGYSLFKKDKINKAIDLMDLSLYIYTYFPSFDQTRKIISIISFINNEFDFKKNLIYKEKMIRLFRNYEFIFTDYNLYDLVDLFPFFHEYNIYLSVPIEENILKKIFDFDDPILWANFLIYSNYSDELMNKVQLNIENKIKRDLPNITKTQFFERIEFWDILIFHNCPYLSSNVIDEINNKIELLYNESKFKTKPNDVCNNLLFEFLMQNHNNNKPKKSFFDWSCNEGFGEEITFKTYKRTLFKNYKSKGFDY